MLKVWSGPEKNYIDSTNYIINVKNSIKLSGVIDGNVILNPDKEYLVSENLLITEGSILTLKPGSKLLIDEEVSIKLQANSKIIALGNKDSIISFSSSNATEWSLDLNLGDIYFDFVKIQHLTGYLYTKNDSYIKNTIFENNATGTKLWICRDKYQF